MRCKTLINLLSKYNEHNIIAALKYNPKVIVFIRYKSQRNKEIFIEVKKVIQKQLPGVQVIDRVINVGNPYKIEEIIEEYNDKDTVINLSGGSKISSIIAYKTAIEKNLKAVLVDLKGKGFYKIQGKNIELQREPFATLKVEEIIATSGAMIVEHSTNYYEDENNMRLLYFIMKHFQLWKRVKEVLKNKDLISIDKYDLLSILVTLKSSDGTCKESLAAFLEALKSESFIEEYKNSSDYISFRFKDIDTKRFILTSGTWLEALIYQVVRDMDEVNDVKSGVLFAWDKDLKEVRNEIDVIAALDSILICISCKDTDKYDVEELNELQVYSEKLGGEEVKKILVASREPARKELVLERAEEMNIDIVIFNEDLHELKARLKDIITHF